ARPRRRPRDLPSGPTIQRLNSIDSCPPNATANVESAASNRWWPSSNRIRPGESSRALERVLEVEQAQIILAALADDDLALALLGVGEQLAPLGVELALQRFGEGRHPHRSARVLGPQRSGREVGEGLADAGAGFGEQHVRRILRPLRGEYRRYRRGHRLLPL